MRTLFEDVALAAARENDIDEMIREMDDGQQQRDLEDQETWERHRKAVKALEKMLDEMGVKRGRIR